MEYRFWSKKIVNVLRIKNTFQNKILFGITGDLDNLGIFVSKQGRAVAENLVETYNHIIGAYCNDFVQNHSDIVEFAFLPSGEEIFAIGVADTKEVVDSFFSKLHTEINPLLKQSPIQADYVTISFGTKIFNDIPTQQVTDAVDSGDVTSANKVFLDTMLEMRKQLALELDKDKFKTLDCEDLAVFFRNCVYSKMREYKTTTRSALIDLSEKLKSDSTYKEQIKQSALNQNYGVDDDSIQNLLNLLSNTGGDIL